MRIELPLLESEHMDTDILIIVHKSTLRIIHGCCLDHYVNTVQIIPIHQLKKKNKKMKQYLKCYYRIV